METVSSPALLADLSARAPMVRARIARVTGELRPDQLLWSPPQGGWSIAQVVEHLLVTDGLYHQRIRAAIDRGRRAKRQDQGRPWRPTLSGKFLYGVVQPDNTRRARAPGAFAPSPRPRPSVAPSYLALMDELSNLLREAEGLDLTRLRFGSPALGLFRLNLGDAFRLTVTHAERHAAQMERVRAHAQFPQ